VGHNAPAGDDRYAAHDLQAKIKLLEMLSIARSAASRVANL